MISLLSTTMVLDYMVKNKNNYGVSLYGKEQHILDRKYAVNSLRFSLPLGGTAICHKQVSTRLKL